MSETDPFNSEEADGMSKRTQLEEYFSQSLEIDLLLRLCPDDKDIIYQIVDLLVDTCATKSFNIMISTTKLSARTVLRAVKAAFRLYQSKTSQGKQSVRTLLRQNRGVSSVEISKTGIRGLERYAKKYGIDYAIRKDTSEVPPRYLVFFKAPDAEAFNSAFKEYSASLLNKDKRPSVLAKLHELVQAAAELPGKVRHKEQERGL